jgi:two-component system response regulator
MIKYMNSTQIDILLAEDNMDDAEMTILALTSSKLINNIIHLHDGVETIDFLFGTGKYAERDTRQQPKLILLDLKMPKVDGMEVLEKIKSDARTKDIPAVVLTSSRESPDLKRCYALGANSYIVKPVAYEGLMKAVQDVGMYWMILNQLPD